MKRRYVQIDGELVEVTQDYARPSEGALIVADITPYASPIDGRAINSRAQRAEDLKRSGSRPYEGREQEQKEINRQKQYAEQRADQRLEQAIHHTLNHMPERIRREILSRR